MCKIQNGDLCKFFFYFNAGSDPFLRDCDPGDHQLLRLRQPAGDRASLPETGTDYTEPTRS